MKTEIRLVPMSQQTGFAPLGVLGYCLTRTRFLDTVFGDLSLPMKKVEHQPSDKLQDLLVSVLAGCRSVSAINTQIRPDVALAQAWGRERFAEQSNVARTLDAFSDETISQLRAGSERLFRQESHTLRHDFRAEWLWLDTDLTPMPASKQAQSSTKGKIGGKKINMGDNYQELTPLNIEKHSFLTSIRASNKVVPSTYQPWTRWLNSYHLTPSKSNAQSFGLTQALAAMTMSTMPSIKAGRCSPKAKVAGDQALGPSKWQPKVGIPSATTAG